MMQTRYLSGKFNEKYSQSELTGDNPRRVSQADVQRQDAGHTGAMQTLQQQNWIIYPTGRLHYILSYGRMKMLD